MKHLILLFILITLLFGSWTVFYIYQKQQKSRMYHYPYFKFIFIHTIFFNLLVLNILFSFYFDLNISSKLLPAYPPLIQDIGYIFSCFIEVGMIFYMIKIVYSFKKKKLTNLYKLIFFSSTAFLIISYIARMILDYQNITMPWLEFTYNYITDDLILVEIIYLVNLYIYARKLSDKDEKKIITAFAFLYLGRYSFLLILLPISKIILLFFFLFPLIFANIAPIIWIKYYFLKYVRKLDETEIASNIVDNICKTHSISSREQQILKLLLEGKSNREIENTLFISYHTVKNHVYNLYQKMGIKNRFELVNLISKQNKIVI